MTTQYSPILKLALPVQGELSGTWGDVVNDNITSMVEQAIAGRAVINSWSTNSHSLTSANGTTSESRCAMLELTDTGTALSGAGTVICPALSKIYIVKNAAGQNITVKTASGTGILVPDGRTTFLFCDGTNVVEALTHTTSLQLGTSTTVTAVLDEDNMASNSATSLATQQSIKAYVDSKVGQFDSLAEVLAVGNTTGSNNIIVDNGQKITTNTIDETTAGSGVTIDSVLLKDDVVNATDVETGSISANDGTAAATIANSTGVVTVPSAVLTTADINGGTADGVVIGGATPAAATVTTAVANTSLTIAGTTTVTSILDEDNMASNDPAGLATQQSIKAYVDAQVGTVDTLAEVLGNGNTTGGTDIAVSTGDDITFADSSKAIFGAGSDLQIYHDGSNSYVTDAGTGDLRVSANNLRLQNADNTANYIKANNGSNVELFFNNSAKLATTNTGIQVTGNISNASGDLTIDVAGDIILDADGGDIRFKDGGVAIAVLGNSSSDFFIGTSVQDKDILFKGNDGGSTITALTLDMSAAGAATFNSNVSLTGTLYVDNSTTNGFLSAGSNILNFGTTSNDTLAFYANNTNHMKLKPDGEVILNETGNAEGDLRVESDSNTHMLFVDAGNNRVSIGNSSTYSMFNVLSSNDNTSDWWTNSVATQYMQNTVGHTVLKMNNNNSNRSAYLVYNGNGSAQGFHIFDRQNEQSRISAYTSSVVVNEAGADVDFRVESNALTNAFVIDGGNSGIGFGATPQSDLHASWTQLFVGKKGSILSERDTSGGIAQMSITDNLYMDSDTGSYAYIETDQASQYVQNAGVHTFRHAVSGSAGAAPTFIVQAQFAPDEAVFNNGGADLDFRVESDNQSHMLFVDAGNNAVGIATTSPSYALDIAGSFRTRYTVPGFSSITGTSGNANYWKIGTASSLSASRSMKIRILGTSSYSPGNIAGETTILFRGNNSVTTIDGTFWSETMGNSHVAAVAWKQTGTNDQYDIYVNWASTYAGLDIYVETPGQWAFDVSDTGSESLPSGATAIGAVKHDFMGTAQVTSKYSSGLVVNEGGSGAVDFRVESDGNAHAFFVDASNDSVHIGGSGSNYVANIHGSTINSPEGTLYVNAAVNNSGKGVFIDGNTRSVNENTERLLQVRDRSAYNAFLVQVDGRSVFNDDGSSWQDFRVESTSTSHMLFVDASKDAVTINGSTVAADGSNNYPLSVRANTSADAIAVVGRTNDDIGELGFYESDGTTQLGNLQARVGSMRFRMLSNGGAMQFENYDSGGNLRTRQALYGTEAVFNDGSLDYDFRVESNNNANMFLVDAENDRVKIGSSTGSAHFNVVIADSSTDPLLGLFQQQTDGKDARVQVNVQANDGGDPYMKFDAGGSNMIVGLNWHGTTSNKLKLGAAERPSDTIKGITVSGLGNTSISSTGYEGTLDSTDTGKTGHTLSVAGTHVMQRDANSTGAETMIVNNIHSSGASIGMLQYRTRNAVEGSLNGNSSGLVITNNSDYRKKENITDATGCLTKITGLRPVTYTHRSEYDTDTTTVHTGFIAHEVSDHMPSIVGGAKDAVDDEGNAVLQSVAYSSQEIITNLVGAIKELEARIAALENA